jgi:uncharacterized protein YodC (DUF2158 family)
MQARALEVGDVVVLAGGGPKMTVTQLFADDITLRTAWFDDDNCLYGGDFAIQSLQLYGGKE